MNGVCISLAEPELNCSPIHMRQLIWTAESKLRDYYGYNWIIPEELQKVFDIARKTNPMPAQVKHGKKCSRCLFKMHCKSLRCPRCHFPQRKRKKQTTN